LPTCHTLLGAGPDQSSNKYIIAVTAAADLIWLKREVDRSDKGISTIQPCKTSAQRWTCSRLVMMRIPHKPHDEFPQEKALIEHLTKSNYEFGRLVG